MIAKDLPRLRVEPNLASWARELIDDLNVRLRALTQASVTEADSTYGFLSDKLVAGSNVTLTVLNPGGDEQLQISASGGGGGGGTVTSITSGTGVTVNPDPLTTTGTVNMHVDTLTASLAVASGDEFPFQDVSFGSTITGVRKVTFANLQASMDIDNFGVGASHVIATTAGLGTHHSTSGLTTGQVLRATGTNNAAFQTFTLLNGNTISDTASATANIGDLVYGNAIGRWDRLPIGGALTFLAANTGTGLPEWRGIADADLPVTLSANARVVVRLNTGANIGTRRRLNFIEGAGIDLTIADDGANEEVDITVATTGLIDGTGAAGGVAFWTDANTLSNDTNFLYSTGNDGLQLGTNASSALGVIAAGIGDWDVTIGGTLINGRISSHAQASAIIATYLGQMYSATPAHSSRAIYSRSRGTSAAQTVVSNDDVIMQLDAVAHDGTDYEIAARIQAEVDDAAPSSTRMGGALVFSTTTQGGLVLSERLRIAQDGDATFTGNVDVRSVAYTWPAANAAGVLTNNGAGTLTWSAGGGGASLEVQEDGVTRETSVGIINFLETSTTETIVTNPVAGTVDVDLSQYLLLAGRTGSTNNALISTSGGVGSITGSSSGGGQLALFATTAPATTGETIALNSFVTAFQDTARYPTSWAGTFNLISVALTTHTIPSGDAPILRVLNFQPTWTTDAGITQAVLFRSAPTILTTTGSTTSFGAHVLFNGTYTLTPGGGASSVAFTTFAGTNTNLTLGAAGAASTMTSMFGFQVAGSYNANWTIDDWVAYNMNAPTGTSGLATRLGGWRIADLDAVRAAGRATSVYSGWSIGEQPLCHQGPALLGASQTTLTAPAASTTLELSGTTEALLLNRATTGGIATPANGHIFYNTANNKFTARENAAWVTFLTSTEADALFLTPAEGNAAYQPLDSDLTAVAGLAATAGMLSRTGAGAFAVRTLTGSASITVTNGTGAGGAPTFALADGAGVAHATDVVTGSTTQITNGAGDVTLNTVAATPGTSVDVMFHASVQLDKTAGTNKEVTFKLFKDGTEVNTADRYTFYNDSGSAATSPRTVHMHWVIASESAGAHTYTLRAVENLGGLNQIRRLVSRLTVTY